MCIQFTCFKCNQVFADQCAPVRQDITHKCNDIYFQLGSKDCQTCNTINEAIERLDNLVWMAPFLKTQGLSGLEDVKGWEKEDLRALLFKDGSVGATRLNRVRKDTY